MLFDFVMRNVVGDHLDVGRDFCGGVFLALEDCQDRPLRMFFPEFQDGFCSLEGTAPGKVKEGLVVRLGGVEELVGGGETSETGCLAPAAEDFLGMPALAEDVVDVFQVFEVTLGEPLLVGDEEVVVGGAKPAGENPLEKDIGIEAGFAAEKPPQRGNAATMADRNLMSRSAQRLMDEIHVPVEADTVGARDDVKACHVVVLSG